MSSEYVEYIGTTPLHIGDIRKYSRFLITRGLLKIVNILTKEFEEEFVLDRKKQGEYLRLYMYLLDLSLDRRIKKRELIHIIESKLDVFIAVDGSRKIPRRSINFLYIYINHLSANEHRYLELEERDQIQEEQRIERQERQRH